jgi:hypothetical protein
LKVSALATVAVAAMASRQRALANVRIGRGPFEVWCRPVWRVFGTFREVNGKMGSAHYARVCKVMRLCNRDAGFIDWSEALEPRRFTDISSFSAAGR